MIIDKLKAWLAPALAIAASLFAALAYRQKAKLEQERREAIEGARAVEHKATDAASEGQQRIEEARNVPVDTDRRDQFERP